MLDADQLASLRTTLNASLPGTVVIERPTLTDNGAGGQIAVWASPTGGTVSGRLSPRMERAGEELPMGNDAVTAHRRFIVTLPNGTDVRATDRLVTYGGTYDINNLDNPRSYAIDMRVDVVLRAPA